MSSFLDGPKTTNNSDILKERALGRPGVTRETASRYIMAAAAGNLAFSWPCWSTNKSHTNRINVIQLHEDRARQYYLPAKKNPSCVSIFIRSRLCHKLWMRFNLYQNSVTFGLWTPHHRVHFNSKASDLCNSISCLTKFCRVRISPGN